MILGRDDCGTGGALWPPGLPWENPLEELSATPDDLDDNTAFNVAEEGVGTLGISVLLNEGEEAVCPQQSDLLLEETDSFVAIREGPRVVLGSPRENQLNAVIVTLQERDLFGLANNLVSRLVIEISREGDRIGETVRTWPGLDRFVLEAGGAEERVEEENPNSRVEEVLLHEMTEVEDWTRS